MMMMKKKQKTVQPYEVRLAGRHINPCAALPPVLGFCRHQHHHHAVILPFLLCRVRALQHCSAYIYYYFASSTPSILSLSLSLSALSCCKCPRSIQRNIGLIKKVLCSNNAPFFVSRLFIRAPREETTWLKVLIIFRRSQFVFCIDFQIIVCPGIVECELKGDLLVHLQPPAANF